MSLCSPWRNAVMLKEKKETTKNKKKHGPQTLHILLLRSGSMFLPLESRPSDCLTYSQMNCCCAFVFRSQETGVLLPVSWDSCCRITGTTTLSRLSSSSREEARPPVHSLDWILKLTASTILPTNNKWSLVRLLKFFLGPSAHFLVRSSFSKNPAKWV